MLARFRACAESDLKLTAHSGAHHYVRGLSSNVRHHAVQSEEEKNENMRTDVSVRGGGGRPPHRSERTERKRGRMQACVQENCS